MSYLLSNDKMDQLMKLVINADYFNVTMSNISDAVYFFKGDIRIVFGYSKVYFRMRSKEHKVFENISAEEALPMLEPKIQEFILFNMDLFVCGQDLQILNILI